MKNVIFGVFLNLVSFNTIGQTISDKSLDIGAKIPDVSISNIQNYSVTTAKISSFAGKLLILDFWGVNCPSCIEEMPTMERYQKEFGNKIQIILVTKDSKKKVAKLAATSKFFRSVNLPLVTDDTVLSAYFPYFDFGLHVWIDGHETVVQKTRGESYTADTITAFLNGQAVKLPDRTDISDFDYSSPLWKEGGGRQSNHIKYYSYIAEEIPDAKKRTMQWVKDSLSKQIVGVNVMNLPLQLIYPPICNEGGRKSYKKTIVELKDSSDYFSPADKTKTYDWWQRHSYSYQLLIPSQRSRDVWQFMHEDLERFFLISAVIEKRKTLCWILSCPDTTLVRFRTSGGKAADHVDEAEKSVSLINVPVRELIDKLDYFSNVQRSLLYDETNYTKPPVIDETGITFNIDFAMQLNNWDLPSIKNELKKWGLVLTEEDRVINALIIKDVLR